MGANFPFVSTAFFAFFPNAITIVRIFLFGPKWAYLMIKVHTKNLPQILGNDTQYASKLALNCNWAVCHVWCPPMNLLLSANSPLLLSYLPAPKVFVVVWWLPPGSQHRRYVGFFFHSVYEQELHGHWAEHLSLFLLLFSSIAVPVLNRGKRGLLYCYHYPIFFAGLTHECKIIFIKSEVILHKIT